MKKIWLILIGSIVVLGFLSFFIINLLPKEISVDNYNGTSSLSLGNYHLSYYQETKAKDGVPYAHFNFKTSEEENRFIEDISSLEGYMGINLYGIMEFSEVIELNYHYIYSNGYYYTVIKYLNCYSLEPLTAYYQKESIEFHFPYDLLIPVSDNSIEIEMTWDDFLNYYQRLSPGEVEINIEEKSIKSRAIFQYRNYQLEGYPIVITYNEGIVSFSYEG